MMVRSMGEWRKVDAAGFAMLQRVHSVGLGQRQPLSTCGFESRLSHQ